MLRDTLLPVIDRLRVLIHDPAGLNEHFNQEQLQDILDSHRLEVPSLVLDDVGDGWFAAPIGAWESDAFFIDDRSVEVVADEVDWVGGRWQLEVATVWPVAVTGRTYDLNAAAADALKAWAAALADDFDFSTQGQSFARSQKARAKMELADRYRKEIRVGSAVPFSW